LAATPGYTGQAKIGANVIANVKSNQFDLQRAMEDVTVMLATPSPFKVFAPTLIDMTFQLTCDYRRNIVEFHIDA
jgi:hypothetical protein